TGYGDIGGSELVYQGTNESLSASSGTLRFTGGSVNHTHAGTLTIGSNVEFDAGTHTLSSGGSLSGALNLVGSTFVVPGTFTVPSGNTFNWGAGTTIWGP